MIFVMFLAHHIQELDEMTFQLSAYIEILTMTYQNDIKV